ncbi:unnamed protein product [Trifolium pratense]|uniref:Uncharacterized protein n=1 Tax=Trifolium pratense TaxID=57577 RepID=A0ACB0M9D1_TRIPR|nr:unnamed protein product [Trifolium pratense]
MILIPRSNCDKLKRIIDNSVGLREVEKLDFDTRKMELLKRGLWKLSWRSIVCYPDSLKAVSLIKDGVLHFHTFANEIHNIRQLLRRDWNVVIDHILREGNKCADILAKLGTSSNSPKVVLESSSPELSSSLGF